MVRKQTYVWIVLLCIGVIFSILRFSPIFSQSVIYTYDQGRDFIAGARIILDQNPVFIGPTTGIGGVFHGAWWYYVIALSFLIMGPEPMRYYIFLFFIHLVTFIVFFWAMRRQFDTPTALWTSLVAAVGSYYININTFAGNNVLAVPSFVYYLVLLGFFLRSRPRSTVTRLIALGLGLSIGFVSEFELSFGMFLIPAFVILAATSSHMRSRLKDLATFVLITLGIVIPFVPRVLFEIKNGFLQTKVIIGFFTQPKLYNPVPYTQVVVDRFMLFTGYSIQAYGSYIVIMLVSLAFIFLISRVLMHKTVHTNSSTIKPTLIYLRHVMLTLFLLFTLSLVYRDTFWVNYYEGIQYGFLVLGGGTVYLVSHYDKRLYVGLVAALILVTGVISVTRLIGLTKQGDTIMGLSIQQTVVQHIVDMQKTAGQKEFCARVFTPPVIPHTYDYLWLWHYLDKETETPRYDFINNRCWYIIEPEWKGYEFRQVEWKKRNIPTDAVPVEGTRKVISGIEIIQYAILQTH